MSELNDKYLIFEVDEHFAIEITAVVEIIEYIVPTRVPDTPEYIAGMINLRGNIVPVIDIRARFKKNPLAENARRCIIITNVHTSNLGLIVDNVSDLIQIPEAALTDPPQVGANYTYVFIKAIGIYDDKMNLIVDTDKLIHYSDLEELDLLDTSEIN